ncbi:hypothetical protein SKAU_G00354480 [Synaphobranchus kaupii]|uniref:Uncharacterized protein n=1 Tax=Synaphobranchus kaupii TaxID=118154 RepID=A0A9Q1EH71_SYNKA|nr:hypothetical protein SKAU_G00354480 [Synaphobranchus kaupii]
MTVRPSTLCWPHWSSEYPSRAQLKVAAVVSGNPSCGPLWAPVKGPHTTNDASPLKLPPQLELRQDNPPPPNRCLTFASCGTHRPGVSDADAPLY